MDDTALKFLTSQPKEIVRATNSPAICVNSEQPAIPVVAESGVLMTNSDSPNLPAGSIAQKIVNITDFLAKQPNDLTLERAMDCFISGDKRAA